MNDPGSLDNLRDIATPEAVSMWPSAPGWWILGLVLFVALLVFGYKALRKWLANRYRQHALLELENARDDRSIAEVLKRTALAAYPRTDVASLSGEDWCQWLADQSGLEINESIRNAILLNRFQRNAELSSSFQSFAEDWIRHHRGRERC